MKTNIQTAQFYKENLHHLVPLSFKRVIEIKVAVPVPASKSSEGSTVQVKLSPQKHYLSVKRIENKRELLHLQPQLQSPWLTVSLSPGLTIATAY